MGAADGASPAEVDSETLRRLRELGYIANEHLPTEGPGPEASR
jgi:hypothetical protein